MPSNAAAPADDKQPDEASDERRDPMYLAALVASRVCHDLISPVAALSTGADVLRDEDDDEMRAHALDLVMTSAAQAGVKLEFARLAFGAAGRLGAEIELDDAKKLTERFFEYLKQTLHWTAPTGPVDKDLAKSLMNLCVIAAEAIPRGGDVSVSLDADHAFLIDARGPKARLNEAVRDALDGRPDELNAKMVQPFLAGELARAAGHALSFVVEDERVLFRVARVG